MANISQIQSALNQVAREHAHIKDFFSSSRAIAEAFRAFDLPQLRIASEFAEAMQRDRSAFAEITRSATVMKDIQRQMAASRAFMDSIVSPFAKIQESIRLQASVFEEVAARMAEIGKVSLTFPRFSESAFAWQCSAFGLTDRMRAVDLLNQREMLANRLLAAPITYSGFVERTTELLAKTSSEQVASALRGSLNLAETQLLDIAGNLSNIVAVPDDADEPLAERLLNAPVVQQDELLAGEAVESEEDSPYLVSLSETAGLVGLSKEVLQLVTTCNEAGKTSLGHEIFKPTTRLLEVFTDLPWIAATDRRQLADIVDCLYFIFYEGAGKDNLRFMTASGGPLDDKDCDLIWCIKHLRNKWTRHDADHGKEKDIQKSWNDLAAKFRWLNLSEHPTEAAHFQLLQRRLLEESMAFLRLILSRLTIKE